MARICTSVIPAALRILAAASAPVSPEALLILRYFAKVLFSFAEAASESSIPMIRSI